MKYGALLGLQALVGRIVLDSADIVRDGDLPQLQQVGLELPDFLSLLTVSPTAIGVALGVRFLEDPHEFLLAARTEATWMFCTKQMVRTAT